MTKHLSLLAGIALTGIAPLAHAENATPAAPTGPITPENTAEALATPVEKRTAEQKALVYAKIQAGNRARVEKERLDYLREMVTVRAGKIDLAKLLDGHLTDADGKPVAIETITKARYVAFYHSSSWCCGCKTYTPLLIEAVRNHDPADVAIVLVSWDESAGKTRKYMHHSGMPWASVTRETIRNSPAGLGIKAIPHMRVFDAADSLVLDSLDDKGQHTIGQAAQIAALDKLVATPVAAE